jgi:hypothetical protein
MAKRHKKKRQETARKELDRYAEPIVPRVEGFIRRHEKVLVLVIFLLALFRVFLFSAAFPFFNNVDEREHLDTVVKYSRGYLPHKGANHYDRESAKLIIFYETPEYLNKPQDFNTGKIPEPLWKYPKHLATSYLNEYIPYWTNQKNSEAFSTPTYYIAAGVWYNFGKLLSLKGGYLLYWTRFLNIVVYAFLLFFSYRFCKDIDGDNLFLRIGVLLMLIFFPQDAFYSINSDVLSPLLFLLSLYLLLKIYFTDRSLWFHLITGLVITATLLVKLSNLPLIVILAVMLFFKGLRSHQASQLKEKLPALFLLFAAAILPFLFWLGWCYYALGDITGSAEKISKLGWQIKTLGQIWNHPIFGMSGLIYFITELTKTFWRGEFVWGLERISSSGIDLFYVISSCLFLSSSVIGLFIYRTSHPSHHRLIDYTNILCLFLSVSYLAALSTLFDFGTCLYPSREHPYFTSGRLISGALVPFLILYLEGLNLIMSKITKRISPWVIILAIVMVMALSEIWLTLEVFKSPHNFFHLP